MCCSSAKWKREHVQDHKFDFIDVSQFHSNACGTRFTYGWLWLMFIKSIAVYIADIYTLVALLASNRWSASILQSDAAKSDSTSSNVLEVPFSIGKWIFFGCIIFSFLLLLWEARKSRAIIKSRDISYAFTNVMSNNWYALRSYDHYCFFCQIDNSKKKKDEVAFFVFFTFKGWKRLLLADAPRQVINALTLYSFGKSEKWTTDFSVYWSGSLLKKGILVSMIFTVVVWVISAACLLVAAVLYVPLLCYIQGNLKEYCCHKVDKRIAELMKRKNKKRLAAEAKRAAAEARGDFSHLKDKSGKMVRAPMAQPTLPKIGIDDDDIYSETGSVRGGGGGGASEKYSYPPQPPTLGYANSAPYSSSNLARHAYPYASSDSESLVGKPSRGAGYAESVTSLDAFASRAAPMGMGGASGGLAYSDSTATLVQPQQPTRTPSYRTMPSSGNLHQQYEYGGGGGAEYDEKYAQAATATNRSIGASQFGGLAFDGPGAAESSAGTTPALLSHSVSMRSTNAAGGGGGVDYQPPSVNTRQALYDRALRQNEDDALPYFMSPEQPSSHHGQGGGSVAYKGWEESGGAGWGYTYGGGGGGGGEGEQRVNGGGERAASRAGGQGHGHGGMGSDGGGNLAGRGAWSHTGYR